ncbi:MAG: GNAT family N-acetyltransferase [Verrucomicrobiota bacterium]
MEKIFETSFGRARLLAPGEVRGCALWAQSFGHLSKDSRFHEVVDEALGQQFDFHYLLLEGPDGEARGVQPFFFVDQDLIMTAPKVVRTFAATVRTLFPRFLRLRMLMAGCAAGEGHPASAPGDWHWTVAIAAEVLPKLARRHGAPFVIWKDWPARYREVCRGVTTEGRFVRIPSMPATELLLEFKDFDDYMRRHLSHAMRKNLRRKFKATRDIALPMTVVSDVELIVDEVLALYEQVFARSTLKFERLTREFLLLLGKRMPDRTRFFLWRHEGRLVACSICLVHGDTIYDEYLCLDYSVALTLHLYFVTMRDVLSWAMANGIRRYCSTPLNYDPKLHLGFALVPLDLYVAGSSPLLHAVIRRVLPWIEPTRSQPILQKFPNAAVMNAWADVSL